IVSLSSLEDSQVNFAPCAGWPSESVPIATNVTESPMYPTYFCGDTDIAETRAVRSAMVRSRATPVDRKGQRGNTGSGRRIGPSGTNTTGVERSSLNARLASPMTVELTVAASADAGSNDLRVIPGAGQMKRLRMIANETSLLPNRLR